MDRSDSRRQMSGGASMARSKSAAKEDMSDAMSGGGPKKHEVSTERGIGTKTVEAHGAIGSHNAVQAKGAEGDTDMASSKANRKENYEPEREAAEKRAIDNDRVEHSGTFGSGRHGTAVPTKHTMGHGEREPKASNTV
jgi:hypothetical protein